MISVSNPWASLAYFYEDILLIFMNVKFYKVQIDQRKTNNIYGYLLVQGVVRPSGDRKYIERLNNQNTNTPSSKIFMLCNVFTLVLVFRLLHLTLKSMSDVSICWEQMYISTWLYFTHKQPCSFICELFYLLCASIMKSAVEGEAEFNQMKNQPWMNFDFE